MASPYGSSRPKILPASSSSWPAVLRPEAYHGLVGNIVRLIEPFTEADNAAILVQLLVAIGNALGHAPHFRHEEDYHALNLFTLVIGNTSSGKGVSLGWVRQLMTHADPTWPSRVASGLVSGEGLIWHVRDRETDEGRAAGLRDMGMAGIIKFMSPVSIPDKRLLVAETEFAAALKVMARDTNTLSPIIRNAWDGVLLQTMGKHEPATATDAHVSIIGHVTPGELSRYLTQTEIINGFLNRFLPILVRRSKQLPDEQRLPTDDLLKLAAQLAEVVSSGATRGQLKRTAAAAEWWRSHYALLVEEKAEPLAAATGRARAQVTRLSTLYAVIDGAPAIDVVHMEAAFAVWTYVEESLTVLFSQNTADPTTYTILNLLSQHPEGLSQTEFQSHLSRHLPEDFTEKLGRLREAGIIRSMQRQSGGRPATIYVANYANDANNPQSVIDISLPSHNSQPNDQTGSC